MSTNGTPKSRTKPTGQSAPPSGATPAATERHLAKRRIRETMPPPPPGVTLPVTGWVVPLPTAAQIPWIAGLGLAAAVELIDWPVAILLAVGHTIMTNSKNEQLRELAEGVEAAL